MRSETSFGGGKTHSLIAVYHLAKGARPASLSELIDPALLPRACSAAAIVADTLDPVNGLETNGFVTHTLWGELGAQLGPSAYEELRRSDETRAGPVALSSLPLLLHRIAVNSSLQSKILS